jgi:hypothetical protein
MGTFETVFLVQTGVLGVSVRPNAQGMFLRGVSDDNIVEGDAGIEGRSSLIRTACMGGS